MNSLSVNIKLIKMVEDVKIDADLEGDEDAIKDVIDFGEKKKKKKKKKAEAAKIAKPEEHKGKFYLIKLFRVRPERG